MLYFSLVLSGLLLLVVNVVAFWRGKATIPTASVLSAVLIVPALMLTLILIALNALLVALAGAGCYIAGARPRWFLVSSLVATVTAYGLVAWRVTVTEVQEWERMKVAYPGESLEDRLRYEDAARPAAPAPAYDGARLSHFEERIQQGVEDGRRALNRSWRRDRALEKLHAGVVQHFIDSPGFGVARMPAARPHDVEWEGDEVRWPDEFQHLVPQPLPTYTPAEPDSEIVTAGAPEFAAAHDDNTLAFLNPMTLGVGHDRGHVFDFKPHGFHQVAAAPQRWQVARLELIGLLKYHEPRAYVSEHLPAMEELRDAETRSLDAFEGRAISALLRGEDVMVQEAGDGMSVLGSIRAVKQCVRCHRVERGELLGAFSYKLTRKP